MLGDAIEVQLPPASGYSSTPASEKDARQIRERAGSGRAGQGEPRIETEPVQVRDGRLTVNYGPFFDGERVSVIVRVRKAEGAQAAEKAEGADR